MSLRLSLTVVCFALFCGVVSAQSEDPVAEKLSFVKAEYENTVQIARETLLSNLQSKIEAVQKAGDLKALETIHAEIKAYETNGELPKSIQVKAYLSQLQTAYAKLEEWYEAAIKRYTRDGNITLAKTTQLEFEKLKMDRMARGMTPEELFKAEPDLYMTSRKWSFGEGTRVFTVLTFKTDGTIEGNVQPHESQWKFKTKNEMNLCNPKGTVTSVWKRLKVENGLIVLGGDLVGSRARFFLREEKKD